MAEDYSNYWVGGKAPIRDLPGYAPSYYDGYVTQVHSFIDEVKKGRPHLQDLRVQSSLEGFEYNFSQDHYFGTAALSFTDPNLGTFGEFSLADFNYGGWMGRDNTRPGKAIEQFDAIYHQRETARYAQEQAAREAELSAQAIGLDQEITRIERRVDMGPSTSTDSSRNRATIRPTQSLSYYSLLGEQTLGAA